MRTLVVAPNWIGDAVMAQPLLAALRAADPEGLIAALAPPHIAPVLGAMREVDEVVVAPNVHGRLDLSGRWRLARGLRRQRFDRCFVLPNSAKSALVPFLAGIPVRVGWRGEARHLLINRMHDERRAARLPMVEFYARLALAPGMSPKTRIADPVLVKDPTAEVAIRARLGIGAHTPLFALCPGAEYGPAKRWPVRHFAALAAMLGAEWPDAAIVLLGAQKERDLATEIVALSGRRLHNLCGETSLAEALALLASADGVVSNDSGLMHVTAAFGRPQVAVFGSSDPGHTPPRSARARIEWLHLACSPCFERSCPLGHTDCLNNIPPDAVLAALKDAMRAEPTHPETR